MPVLEYLRPIYQVTHIGSLVGDQRSSLPQFKIKYMEARRYDRVCTAHISKTFTKKHIIPFQIDNKLSDIISRPNSTRFELIYHQYTSVFICKFISIQSIRHSYWRETRILMIKCICMPLNQEMLMSLERTML